MAYSDFTLKKFSDQFGINSIIEPFLPQKLDKFIYSSRLLEELGDANYLSLSTEKAKSEYIIKPIMTEFLRNNLDKMSLFSGFSLDVDKKQALSGRCDFLCAALPKLANVEAPIFCLVEAKHDNIEKGFGQCGAEMYASRLLNESQNIHYPTMYGCVSVGFLWAFLKLEGNILRIDPAYMGLNLQNPENVLAVLQWILNQF